MKVTQHILEANKTLASFEILPPLKGNGIQAVYDIMDRLIEFNPPFINVTSHREEFVYKKRVSGYFEKTAIRKRPGTVAICAAIMSKYKVDAVPHLICGGFTKQETENALIDLSFLGIQNVLALRGDAAKHEPRFIADPNGHSYAIELIQQIVEMKDGKFLDDTMGAFHADFCVGIAGYPEKHFEAPNLKIDLSYLKQKVQQGADYIVTQMFFDNQTYYNFVKACRELDINVPIIPGLKPLTKRSQLNLLPSMFKVDIPDLLADELRKCTNDADFRQVGIDWLVEQSKDLIKNNAPCLHYYTMGDIATIGEVIQRSM